MEQSLMQRLDIRRKEGNFRALKGLAGRIDFSSNDYLGYSRSPELREALVAAWLAYPDTRLGATGSRLLTGQCPLMEELEQSIPAFHQAEAGLLFNSGYSANLGLISTVPQPGDMILYDAHIHASMHDGMHLSGAHRQPLRHNDAQHLEQRLKSRKNTGRAFVLIESVYSCDGSFAPLKDIAALCEQYQANLVVDEAHATGLFGRNGEGISQHLDVHNRIFARIHTFSKALGGCGAIVLGSTILKDYLINFCRPFIYATALPLPALLAIKLAYQMLPHSSCRRTKIQDLILHFQKRARQGMLSLISSTAAIQAVLIPGNENARMTSEVLQTQGFDVRPLLSPTVKRGSERLRICLHSFNTLEEIDSLMAHLKMAKFIL